MYIQVIQMLTSSFACMSDPASNSSPTTALWPFIAAMCKAVQPNLYVYNNEMMMAIILQSYSQYHLLVLYYYYRLSSFLLYIILYCYLQIIYITTKIDTNLFKLCSNFVQKLDELLLEYNTCKGIILYINDISIIIYK